MTLTDASRALAAGELTLRQLARACTCRWRRPTSASMPARCPPRPTRPGTAGP